MSPNPTRRTDIKVIGTCPVMTCSMGPELAIWPKFWRVLTKVSSLRLLALSVTDSAIAFVKLYMSVKDILTAFGSVGWKDGRGKGKETSLHNPWRHIL